MEYLPVITILGFTALLVAQVFAQWKLGSSNVAKQVIDTYKEQAVQLKEENGKIRDRLRAVEEQLIALRATVEEKDKKIKEYMDMLTLKDPATTKLFSDAAATMLVFSETNPKIQADLTEIKTILKSRSKKRTT